MSNTQRHPKAGDLTFVVLSFEGPDPYAMAGGLATRVSGMTEALARLGFETHLVFIGDPHKPGLEIRRQGRLTLHRWCQWISAFHPGGVYAGEEEKLWDFNHSVPPFLIEQIIRPALAGGRIPVVMAEDWHTAEALIRLHGQLTQYGLRHHCLLFWNANNVMAFHRIDWRRLNETAQLTTVSRYMKYRMWEMGLNPLVIPNGIPSGLLLPIEKDKAESLRALLTREERALMLLKVGRYDPAKRWLMAVEAVAQLKKEGYPVAFILRGGVEPHGAEVLYHASQLGLSIAEINGQPGSWNELLNLLQATPPSDIYNLRFYMPQKFLRPFYTAADAVLANSGHEPYGLVGLEAMAAGGLVFTGATGEDYSLGCEGAVVLDTDSPEEIVTHVLELKARPDRALSLRKAARLHARAFTWERMCEILLDKVEFVARSEKIIRSQNIPQPAQRVRDVVIYTVVHQPRRMRLPAQPLSWGAPADELAQAIFDQPLNEKYFRKVSATCYYPALQRFQGLLEKGVKFAIGLSLSFIEQAQRWDEPLLDRFCQLVSHDNCELVAVEPSHSLLMLWDIPRFVERMHHALDRLEQIFGVRPVVASATEMMMSDTIYHALDLAGFQASFVDGRPWILEWRQPTYLYHHNGGRMKLLTRHYPLSDDVGYRFSNRGWDGWPLMADRYASWLAGNPGDLVILGWDFETFGEHHREDSGIFEFLMALPDEARRSGLNFITPSEAVKKYGDQSYDLPLPAFASTWAGSGGLEFFLGNSVQQAVFQLMIQAYQKAGLTREPALMDLANWLAQSDNLHLIQWYGRSGSDAEVSAYFTPGEWWALGSDRIAWELQQVYKNFIAAMDAYLPHEPKKDTGVY